MIFWIWGNILLIAEFGNKTIHHLLVSSGWMVIIRDQVVLFLLSMGILIKLWSQFYIVSQAVKETCNFCSFPRGAHLMKSGYFEPFNCTIITVLSLLSSVKCSTSWGYGCRRNQMDMDCILIARVCKKHIFKTVFWNTHYITARCKEQQIVETGCVSPMSCFKILFLPLVNIFSWSADWLFALYLIAAVHCGAACWISLFLYLGSELCQCRVNTTDTLSPTFNIASICM